MSTIYLQREAETTIVLGPFVDATDGKTAETGLAGSMTVYRIREAGSVARDSTGTITHLANGFYAVPLSAADTNNPADGGADNRNVIFYANPAGALPVWVHAFLYEDWFLWTMNGILPWMPSQVQDFATPDLEDSEALYNFNQIFLSAHDFTTRRIPADMLAIHGDATAAENAEKAFDGTGYSFPLSKIDANIKTIYGDEGAATHLKRIAQAAVWTYVSAGTITTTTFPVPQNPFIPNGALIGRILYFISGTNLGASQTISNNAVVGPNSVITLAAPLPAVPGVGDEMVIL